MYGRHDLGLGTLVNVTDGGDGNVGVIASAETRYKIGSGTRGIPKSEEHKRKISESNKGKTRNVGLKKSPETCRRLSEAKKGKKFSEEHKCNISKSKKGNQLWLGRKHSEESKRKMSESSKLTYVNKKLALDNSQTL